jgi:hypothetical protein
MEDRSKKLSKRNTSIKKRKSTWIQESFQSSEDGKSSGGGQRSRANTNEDLDGIEEKPGIQISYQRPSISSYRDQHQYQIISKSNFQIKKRKTIRNLNKKDDE